MMPTKPLPKNAALQHSLTELAQNRGYRLARVGGSEDGFPGLVIAVTVPHDYSTDHLRAADENHERLLVDRVGFATQPSALFYDRKVEGLDFPMRPGEHTPGYPSRVERVSPEQDDDGLSAAITRYAGRDAGREALERIKGLSIGRDLGERITKALGERDARILVGGDHRLVSPLENASLADALSYGGVPGYFLIGDEGAVERLDGFAHERLA